MTSLIEIVGQAGAVNSQRIGQSNPSDKSDEDVVKSFLELLGRAEKEDLPEGDVSNEDLVEIGTKLITTLSEIHCIPKIYETSPFSKANEMKLEDRNFFVTPDDLNTNATDFKNVGRLTEAVFSKLGNGIDNNEINKSPMF